MTQKKVRTGLRVFGKLVPRKVFTTRNKRSEKHIMSTLLVLYTIHFDDKIKRMRDILLHGI